jgi:hypothetical protein
LPWHIYAAAYAPLGSDYWTARLLIRIYYHWERRVLTEVIF